MGKKFKRFIIWFCVLTASLVINLTVFAMPAATGTVTVLNKEQNEITINVSSQDSSKDYTIPGSGSQELSFPFTEPGTYEYRITRTDAEEKDYIAQFTVMVDESGNLSAYATPRIEGELEKPMEISFGSEPEPETPTPEPEPETETDPEPPTPEPPTKPEKPEKPTKPSKPEEYKTGDDSNVYVYVLAGIGSIAVLGLATGLIVRRNGRNKNDGTDE